MRKCLARSGWVSPGAAPFLAILLSVAHGAYAAEIGVVEAKTGTGGARTLSLIVEEPTFDWPITIRRNDSGDAPAAVTVDVTTLIGPAARAAERQHLLSNGQPVDQAA